MDEQHRNIFIRQVLSYLQLSQEPDPKAALIVGGTIPLGVGFSVKIGKEYYTSPIHEAILQYQTLKIKTKTESPLLFSTYFPSLDEFQTLFLTDIRTIYYMGDIQDKNTIKFLNSDGSFFKIIKVEIEEP